MVCNSADTLASLTPLLLLRALMLMAAEGSWWHRDEQRTTGSSIRFVVLLLHVGSSGWQQSLPAHVAVAMATLPAPGLCGAACGPNRWRGTPGDELAALPTQIAAASTLTGKRHLARLAAHGIKVYCMDGYGSWARFEGLQ